MADLVVELYGTRVGVLSGPWRLQARQPAMSGVDAGE
jgi:hypothetical protein